MIALRAFLISMNDGEKTHQITPSLYFCVGFSRKDTLI